MSKILHLNRPWFSLHASLISCLILLSITWLSQGCYENQEGCLNPQAVNYQLDADLSCLECCEFPELVLRPLHRLVSLEDTIDLDFDTFYLDNQSQPYRIESVRFYLSQFAMLNTSGQSISIADSLTLSVSPDENQVSFIDDFLLINADISRNLSIGSWPVSDVFTQLSFQFGLSEQASQVIPSSVPNDHPLNTEVTDTYQGENLGYAVARISLFRDTVASDTIPLVFFLDATEARTDLTLPLPFSYSTLPGFNTRVNLQIDYNALFDGINIMSDTSVLQQKIISNLPNVFSVTNLFAESG